MSALKTLGLTLGLTIGIAFAACSFASAQQGNPAANAAANGGSGTHQISQKTASVANLQRIADNQNDHGRKGRVTHHIGRTVYSYYRDGKHCHIVHHLRGPRVRICE
jgi:hypothetical protein